MSFSLRVCNNVGKLERALLLRHAGVKNDLQQEVAELLAQISEIAARDGVGDLVGLPRSYKGAMVAKFCSRSQGQPVPGVRRAAMISRSTGNVAGRAHRTADEGWAQRP